MREVTQVVKRSNCATSFELMAEANEIMLAICLSMVHYGVKTPKCYRFPR
jgi:hypothetical protein